MARSRKKPSATLKTAKVDYRGVLPTVVPKGKVLVHTNVRPQTKDQIPGARGFRAWAEKPSRLLVPCNCGWSGLPHYRSRTPRAYARCVLGALNPRPFGKSGRLNNLTSASEATRLNY